jgi:hypothetical protein
VAGRELGGTRKYQYEGGLGKEEGEVEKKLEKLART